METITAETERMGKVVVESVVSNGQDDVLVERKILKPTEVRTATIRTLVDTGATMLVLPEDIIQQLGLPPIRKVKTRVADGRVLERQVYGYVKLTIQGRTITTEALSAPKGIPALLGQVPLEVLDFLVDSKNQRLIPNPESPDPEMAMYDIL